ncbi:MAG: hypothetical protein HY303_14610 [Candidatus Wallbacteria bacterium]|nr:hypothetical protein [Candidatus Wallbacteria bacterium]
MTRRLEAQLASVNDHTERAAELGCAHADMLRRSGLSPATLDEVQTALRRQMLWVEKRVRELRRRKAGRSKRIKDRVRREPLLADLARRHRDLVKQLEGALQLQRAVLRQTADSYAWLALGEDPLVILPLYVRQTHQLPQGLGLGAPAELARRFHAVGTLFAVENDLTRCLGVGDLTVVFAHRPWRNPLVLEVKASGEWKEGGIAEIGIMTAHSDAPEDVALYDEVSRIIGEQVTPQRVHRLERQDQIDRVLSHTRYLASIAGGAGPRLPGPSARVWRTLQSVTLRALADGASYDLSEPGVAFLALGLHDADPEQRLREAAAGLAFIGFGSDSAPATLADFLREDEWAAVVPPIPLWPISRSARVGLMTGRVYFAAVVKPDLWQNAMQAEGLRLEEDGNGGWRLVGMSGEIHLDTIEVHKLSLGVAFAGISPRDVARRVAEFLARKSGDEK